MTADAVRQLAQQDPLANRMRAYGDDIRRAKIMVEDLTTILRRLDETGADLAEAGITLNYTLGQVGDAAASVRRDLEKQQGDKFTLPRAS